ncbi:hypothetical protein ATANTOWER_031887 [Ataeniobius toweri]|uniref:Uncharacterized protein n=1 Tax=Ataeniobius toweri TaxID=208326 RepID=A0ABU7AD30_9TELE|nr:hypothetical protein [Ataeniobius toweri]
MLEQLLEPQLQSCAALAPKEQEKQQHHFSSVSLRTVGRASKPDPTLSASVPDCSLLTSIKVTGSVGEPSRAAAVITPVVRQPGSSASTWCVQLQPPKSLPDTNPERF